jgi:signal peptidase I
LNNSSGGGWLPSSEELNEELKRLKQQQRFHSVFRSTIFTLVVVASIAVLIATLWMPVLRIYGVSMNPSLEDGNIVISVKESKFDPGEVVAFYYNNKILVKRAVAKAGDWVDIDDSGNVYVNNVLLNEPYIKEKALGDCNIELPYQVPEGRIFVIGDNREVSIDSRNTAVGCVAEEQIVGKLIYRVWPLNRIGRISSKAPARQSSG